MSYDSREFRNALTAFGAINDSYESHLVELMESTVKEFGVGPITEIINKAFFVALSKDCDAIRNLKDDEAMCLVSHALLGLYRVSEILGRKLEMEDEE